MYLGKVKNIHFVGIGGIGMSGIAELMHNQGFQVTGSDLNQNDVIDHLRELGINIAIGHVPENLGNADMIVYSSAVTSDNVEIQEARKRNLLVIRRAEMLAELMRIKYSVAVAGTHGKTTTTSMVGKVMTEGNLDPTIIVGGKLRSLKTNAKLGSGEFLVAEADEFDRSFLRLFPTMAIITTLEAEHLDCYKDLSEIQSAFVEFANRVPFFGSVIVCIDEPAIREIIPRIQRRIVTYGTSSYADFRTENIQLGANTATGEVLLHNQPVGKLSLQLTGTHNLKNALAAIAVGIEVNIPFTTILSALSDFKGVIRRFEIKGVVDDIIIVDDYAHHPTEILVTLRGAKQGWKRRLITIFQPHLYSRTRDFCDKFGQSFQDADILVITDIYPAREKPIPGISGELIAICAKNAGHKNVLYVPDKENVVEEVRKILNPHDMVITMGAGDIWKIGEQLVEQLK